MGQWERVDATVCNVEEVEIYGFRAIIGQQSYAHVVSAVIHELDHSVFALYWLYVVAKLRQVILISGYPCHVKRVSASKADDLVLVQD